MAANFALLGILMSSLYVVSEAFILDTSDAERNVVHQIFVSNGGVWGTWREKQFCPNGTFAKGYQLKIDGAQGDGDDTSLNGITVMNTIEGPQSDGDDTSLNGITLTCAGESSNGGSVTSAVGPWGTYVSTASCTRSNQYLVAFQMNVEPNQNFGDDTAVNDIRFRCRDYTSGSLTDIDSQPSTPHFGQWGSYSGPCPTNSAICGLSTKLEDPQDAGFIHRDDTAINDVVFFCCDN